MSSSDTGLGPGLGTLCVIGLGYIGLPTAVAFAQAGWRVRGVDVSEERVAMVNDGRLPFVEDGLDRVLHEVVASGALAASTAPIPAEVFVISVPTPFADDHSVDMRSIFEAAASITPLLKGGELIILESTVPPGSTERMARAILDARPDLAAGESAPDGELMFAHAPERVLPGRIMAELASNDRIVGGLTPRAALRAKEVYESFSTGLVSATDAPTAELAKLTENSFRDVNIAFANELSFICEDLGIDVWELIELANRHPRVDILQPGPGVGGHCIAVDPWFIVSSAPERARLIRTAREVNDSKPRAVVTRVEELVSDLGITGARIGVLGLAFKADIDDLRESPAVDITRALAEKDWVEEILVVEPNITSLPSTLKSLGSIRLVDLEAALRESEVLVLLVDHREFRALDRTLLEGRPVVDTKGLWRRNRGHSWGRESILSSWSCTARAQKASKSPL
ncbi:UDP-N-acetyl-D-mannosamine dehydrogenase [Schaalia hyovaginalis]|uniref:UDP-N-acetyl-D-mannosamine dehydrogenase n=1 Tax=Schaalia hyovaginalis TaxID=29316 RepID=UPI002A811577|nr:UDP-N-acetyl-D-mannosamine dehydrogenase [Schaalia hyovaginalis]MDY3665757.1 UDP-N-acetyl-D-mannosamine dehydrogenase [Schaalia hyovaginalis]